MGISTRLRQTLMATVLFFSDVLVAQASDHPQLYGRSRADAAMLAGIQLTDDDRRWLWARRVLRLGVSQPD